MSRTTLLTGATGFLGSHLLEALLGEGFQVVIIKRSFSDTWRIAHLIKQVKAYDLDKEPIEKAFRDQHIDVLIHTACNYGRKNEPMSQILETNLLFGLRLLENSIKFKAKTFINTDTFLQRHCDYYSLSKSQFVEWLRKDARNLQVINLKIDYMYGPKDEPPKLIPWVVSQLKVGVPEINLTMGNQKRDFIYVDDVVSAYIKIMQNLHNLSMFSIFDVGSGDLVSLKKFLHMLKSKYEAIHGKINTILNFGALPYREGELMTVHVDNIPLMKLGWTAAYNFESGIKMLLAEKKD